MTEEEFYIEAGKRVKELRKSVGMTQDELSKAVGIPRTLITKFEGEGKKISAYRLKQILHVMGFTLGAIDAPPAQSNGSLWQSLKMKIKEVGEKVDEVLDVVEPPPSGARTPGEQGQQQAKHHDQVDYA